MCLLKEVFDKRRMKTLFYLLLFCVLTLPVFSANRDVAEVSLEADNITYIEKNVIEAHGMLLYTTRYVAYCR